MADATSILTIGLDFDWAASRFGAGLDTNAIRNRALQGLEVLDKADGVHSDTFFLVPDKEGGFEEVGSKLRAGHAGKPWSGVVLGWGVRVQPDMTWVFERLVNLGKDTLPESKLLFTGPAADHLETAQRGFPHLKEAV